jgi:hypothetical protein
MTFVSAASYSSSFRLLVVSLHMLKRVQLCSGHALCGGSRGRNGCQPFGLLFLLTLLLAVHTQSGCGGSSSVRLAPAPAPEPSSHSVTLVWTPSTSAVIGYNVFRGTTSGGPYTLLNSSLVTTTQYQDSNVESGQTYYYVATAVDSSNVESALSNEASATIPNP